ncbi:proton-conducting transporter membrane subunit [Consotaella aegiceratis]|uniref:proton-conducting transporter transmembrane domain-containing protein n=1 Tax=Consotaella aegiceratis TaxID=3097961 RepID=UPI002F3FD25B
MLTASTHDPMAWAWLGTIFLLFGEIAALISLPNLTRVVIVSTIAEIGYVLMGLGLGGAAGDTGAFMHIGYQVLMRGLVVVSGWYLMRRTQSSNLDDLAGSGYRMPLASTLFGFGMFSVMGLSPFKGSFSKFIILYAAIEQGQWVMAMVGTIASIIAAAYYLLVIQKVCFEHPARRVELLPAPRVALPAAIVLALATIAVSLWPHPFQHLAEHLAGAAAGVVPEFESPWAWLVLVPYVGGFMIYGLGRFQPRLRDGAAIALAVATVAMVVFQDGLDPASRLFALLFSGIACIMVVYSVGYMARAEWSNRYYFFVFLMIGSMLGLTTAHELGNFYVFWELMTWSSYFLVIHNQTQKALKAGFLYFLMCAGGAYLMHYGILLVHVELHTFEFAEIAERIGEITPLAGLVTAICFFIGFAVKAGLVPLHSWLPITYPQAPSSASGPLSGILAKAGIFGMVKVLYVVFGVGALTSFSIGSFDLTHVMVVLGCISVLYGEIRALMQVELKRMLAYSSLAQLGEIIAILGIGTALATDAALLHVTNHAVMKTLLFYAAGAFILRTGLRRIDDFAGLGKVMPITAGAYALASFAIMGLPPFSGFTSKFLMIYAAASSGHVLVAAVLLLGGLIGVVYYTRVVATLFYQPYKGNPGVREAPASMLIAIGVLAAAIVLGGLDPSFQLSLVGQVGEMVAGRSGLDPAVLPSLITAWPVSASIAMVGAVAVLLVGSRSVVWAGRLAVVVLVAALGGVLVDGGQMDMLSFCFALLIAGVGALNMMHTTAYLAHSHAQGRFFAAFTVMIAGLLGMTTAKDIFTFFAFWELMSSWALWAAIVHEETFAARREGFKYFLFNSVGASFMFLGVALVAAQAGTFQLAEIGSALAALPILTVAPGVALIFLGFVMKAAMLPVRIDYQMHPALAPTPVSGYISAVLLKAGPWGVLKFFVLFGGTAFFTKFGGSIEGQPLFMEVISVIAGVTIVYAGAMAVLQNGIKLVLIYSTVCQLGYVLMALSFGTTLGVAGGLMYFVNHMLLKDALFLVAGAIMVQSHATMLDELGGLGRKMPITFGVFLFAGLSLAGIPPLNGFASKWMVFEAAFQSGHWMLGAMAMISSLFTLAAIMKFAHAAFLGAPSETAAHAKEAPVAMLVPMLVLTVASVVVGVMPGLLLVPIAHIQADLGMVPIEATLTGPLPGTGGWSPGLMSVLVLALGLILIPWLRLGRQAGVVKTPIHTSGVGEEDLTPASTRVGAFSLYESPDSLIRRALLPKLIPSKKSEGR